MKPRRWLVTGAAGFIGSHLCEALLKQGQIVIGLDNFATGSRFNVEDVQRVTGAFAKNYHFIEGDIRSAVTCQAAAAKVDYVLHQAALGSVPRSLADPVATNDTNVNGFLNVLLAARDQKVKRVVFASSSSVYGDNIDSPKIETRTGLPLSPYAVSKSCNELYARTFAAHYGMEIIGLRYFNVFGPRQNVLGPYAAVIPKWIEAFLGETPVQVHGDGFTSRDFCFVKNVVQMNLRAALSENSEALTKIFNTACGGQTSLIQVLSELKALLKSDVSASALNQISFGPRRPGDIQNSLASIHLAKELLKYEPTYEFSKGLAETVAWFLNRHRANGPTKGASL